MSAWTKENKVKKKLPYLSAILTILLFSVIGYGANDQVMNNSIFKNLRKPAALFNHDYHNGDLMIECITCHHLYEDGKPVKGESSEGTSCLECHPLKATKGGGINLMKAYHLMCKGCHEEKKSGPVMCGQCHKKR
jgi:hypothetical protein